MPIIALILLAITGGNLLWWRWAHRKLARLRAIWRVLLAVFIVGQLLYLYSLLLPRGTYRLQRMVPIPIVASSYLWSLLVLPISLFWAGVVSLANKLTSRTVEPTPPTAPTRRDFLNGVAVAIPPILTASLTARSVPLLTHFRINTIHLQLPGLPRKLDGIRIAHVSDLHVGRYTRPKQIPLMIDAVNKLSADLVLFTGDLIDVSLQDLARGIDAMKRIDRRGGMAIIEGNHDLIDDGNVFDRDVKAAGLPLLLDDAITVEIRNQPIQLLGTRWGESTGNRRRANDAAFHASIEKLKAIRDPAAFPIVLAHHPHTFDPAADADFPLVLSGHTHGGQLMATPTIGCGPLFYRYWSGTYQKKRSQLVVNNGIGNWFPLRINAPAEIIELILHPASEA